MENKNYFGAYNLAQESLEKLKLIKSLLDDDSTSADTAWTVIKPKIVKRLECENVDQREEDEVESETRSAQGSTQFFFTQRNTGSEKSVKIVGSDGVRRWTDIADSLLETLESAHDPPELTHLRNLSDEDARHVVDYLREKLSLKGVYNLCHSLCSMDVDWSMRYTRVICSNLLVPKIIALDQPSRLINTMMQELVEKFPDDVREFVYIPVLNGDTRETCAITTIVNAYTPRGKNDLMLDFLNTVKELKDWHVEVLCQFAMSKIPENTARDKLLDLLLAKASIYSRDRNYGKFILSFVKVNNPFTECQKGKLLEIVAVNKTIFKKVLENLLNNMYFHMELWHLA